MGLLPQHRSGACFCRRDGVLIYSFRYKVIGICKNRDTKCECPASAGPACAAIKISRGGYKVFAAQKAMTYTDLLEVRAFDKLCVTKCISLLSFYSSGNLLRKLSQETFLLQ